MRPMAACESHPNGPMLGWLGFLSPARALTTPEWIFFGVLFVVFGLLPAASVLVRWLRSQVGRTIVTVSTEELHVQERGIIRTRTVAAFPLTDILDVDYSSKDSMMLARNGFSPSSVDS